MICNYCGTELRNNENVCPNCGGPVQVQLNEQKPELTNDSVTVAKQQFSKDRQCYRVIYVILALSLGWLGIHDFYAKYTKRGIIKIILTLTWIGMYVSYIWAIIDAFRIKTTKDNKMFV